MAVIAVYRFSFSDLKTGRNIVSSRYATLKAISKCNGRNIEDSRRLVDTREIDPQGFHQTPTT